MNLVTDKKGERPVIWEWMHKRNKLPWSSDLRVMAAMREDGSIASAVGFNAWALQSCFMHVAFDNTHGLTRDLWRAAFKYPFIECGMAAVYCLIYQNNDEALSLVKKLGYREIVQTVDSVMFEMKFDECRWIKEREHGKQRLSTAST
jgi:hypothetical protein